MNSKVSLLVRFLWAGLLPSALALRADTNVSVADAFNFPANSHPSAPLVLGTNQLFYGTLPGTGTNFGTTNYGSIFSLSTAGAFLTLTNFNRTNGATPYAPLLALAATNFYGTTSTGGKSNQGTIFRFISSTGVLTNLFSFSSTNGSAPYAGLTRGLDGRLYGTTSTGGTNGGYGTVFSISTSGVFSNLVSFNLTNGANPFAGLVLASNGNFYGTTRFGGANGLGTIFVMGPDGSLTNLVSFDGNNGALPGGLSLARDTNFYGTTLAGGTSAGMVFKLSTNNILTVLGEFDGINGAYPNATLMQANNGTIYGTTQYGGDFGQGTIFTVKSGANVSLTNFNVTVVQSFDGSFGTGPQGSLVQGADGNIYGTTLSGGKNHGGVMYQLGNFVPFIVTQPKNRSSAAGTTAIFSVVAGGSTSLVYQWRNSGGDLSDDGHFFGTATSSLTISNVTLADMGFYSVEVTNSASAVVSTNALLTVTSDKAISSVTITTPAVNARTTNPTITGTVAINTNTPRLIYWITNINDGVVTVSMTNDATVQSTNATRDSWSATPTLLPGTNILAVRTLDLSSGYSSTNFSAEVTRSFFYRVPSAFVLTTNGNGGGTLTGVAAVAGDPLPTNGAMLDIGAGYTITAKPDAHSFFTNWTGSLGTITNSTLHIVMEPGVTLQANFVTNLFIRMAATYNGLFAVASGTTEETAGMVSGMTVSSFGVYAGRVLISGGIYSFSGQFNMGGSTTNIIARPAANGGPVIVSMYLDWNNSPRQVLGTVTGTNGGAWSADLLLTAATTNKASGEFTMLLPTAATGYGLFTNKVGIVTASGKLSDGTAFTQTVPMSETGAVPLYASLYANTGLLTGWLNFSNGSSTVPKGTLTWIKKAARTPLLYTNGFTNVIAVTGSTWLTPPRGTATLPYPTNAPATLDITDGNLAAPLSFSVGVTTNNVLVKVGASPTNSLTGTIDPKTGLLTVTFGNGKGKATTIGYGAVLQNATNAAGFFLGTNVSGAVSLHP